jgi:anthranilate phosphoribosyltransferase
MQIQAIFKKLLDRQHLSALEMRELFQTMMTGKLTDAQIAGLLIALRCKGETVEEITAAVEVIREMAQIVPITGEHIIDTCGTGGDGAHTFNISTAAAFVVAAAGGKVAKHGNRSVSSNCGSADLLEIAGVNLELSALQVADCVNEIGVGFLFAAKHHNAMRFTVGPRKEMGVRTLFNLIGPMSNPAGARHQLIGVYDKQWLIPVVEVLKKLGSHHVLAVHAEDGLDEISIAGVTEVAELRNGEITTYRLRPEDYGLRSSNLNDLVVANAAASLEIIEQVFADKPGPAKDIVALNAGAAIYAADLCRTLEEGVIKAFQVIENGGAQAKFKELIAFTNKP